MTDFPRLSFEPEAPVLDIGSQFHGRYYDIAGVTVRVESDVAINDETFAAKFRQFEVKAPGNDVIEISHHFGLPSLNGSDLGKEVYRKLPWAIYRKDDSWIYAGITEGTDATKIHQIAVCSDDHSQMRVYHNDIYEKMFRKGSSAALTLFPTDQILLARVLANRQGCFMHSSGAILDGKGMLFVGHSEAGKSTMVKLLQSHAEILCDDRNIVRRWPEGFRVHGTWSHGEVPLVSHSAAPLDAILFLHKSIDNRITRIGDTRIAIKNLLACLIKPLVTAEWWESMLTLVENIGKQVPCYDLQFDKSGQVVDLLKGI